MYLLGIVLTIILGAFLQFTFCCGTTAEAEVVSEPEVIADPKPEKISNPLAIADPNGNFEYSATQDNFNFNRSEANIVIPVSMEVETGALKLVSYLNDNPSKSIDITGHYSSNENYSGALPNLGMARANEVKKYLVEKGASAKQINIFGQLQEDLIAEDNILVGPTEITIKTSDEAALAAADDELKKMAEAIKADPLVLYFNTNESEINLTTAQRQKIANISKYLDKVEDAVCLTVGHTDSRGKLKKNIELGQDRADFAKEYLINQGGIAASRIEAISKGPKEPIASNKTKKGQAKNRRTVITLK